MKVYTVHPGFPAIRVSDGRSLPGLGGPIAWGDGGMGAFYLSKAIIADVYGDETMAHKFAQRFKWRAKIPEWKNDQAHGLTEEQVRSIVDEITKVSAETAGMIQRMERERPPIESDAPARDQGWRPGTTFKANK